VIGLKAEMVTLPPGGSGEGGTMIGPKAEMVTLPPGGSGEGGTMIGPEADRVTVESGEAGAGLANAMPTDTAKAAATQARRKFLVVNVTKALLCTTLVDE
jgi:hypothetical protein